MKVLDIGRAVRLLQHQAGTHPTADRASRNPLSAKAPLEGTAVLAAAAQPRELLSREVTEDFAAELRTLAAAPTFNGAAMAHTVDRIHDRVRLLAGCCYDEGSG